MSERSRNLLYGAALGVATIVLGFLILTAPSDTDRVANLGQQIKCPVCQGESIANSPADMARDMMALVEQRVTEGVSDQAIIDELLASYTGAVLLDPPASGSTLLLWLLPIVAVVAGAGVIVWWKRHPGKPTPKEPSEIGGRKRLVAGGAILVGALAFIVVAAGFFLQDRAGPNSGVADLAGVDLDSVSNETMEAVIAANLENPQINGMRLALGERYYEIGDYQGAFPHYLAVAESTNATDVEAVSALIRLGWMAWDGNRATEAALGMFDEALEIAPASTTARYLKGQVLWCGGLDPAGAAELFTEVLEADDLPADTRSRIETDLAAVTQGASCT